MRVVEPERLPRARTFLLGSGAGVQQFFSHINQLERTDEVRFLRLAARLAKLV